MHDTMTSTALYAACFEQDSLAQHEAYTTLWNMLYRVAYAMLHEYPDGDAITTDCTQKALIKIHRNIEQCQNPATFREWCMQIVRRTVLDELRRPEHRRRASMPDAEHGPWVAPIETLQLDDLRAILNEVIEEGPLSARSRRVVVGRYFSEQNDDILAQTESELAQKPVLASHIQVTRAKNLAALRRDPALIARLREFVEEG